MKSEAQDQPESGNEEVLSGLGKIKQSLGHLDHSIKIGNERILRRFEKTEQSCEHLDHYIKIFRNGIIAVLLLLVAETGIMIHQANKLKEQTGDLVATPRQSSSPTDAALPPRSSLSN